MKKNKKGKNKVPKKWIHDKTSDDFILEVGDSPLKDISNVSF